MAHKVNNLNGDFGVIIEGVSREDLCSSEFRQQAHHLWIKNGGLIGLRGIDLNKLTSNELMDWSAHFGDVDHDNFVAREDKKVDGLPIPSFSSSFTNDASVNLAIGLVKC